MAVVVLLAGILLVVYGLASLAAGDVAAHARGRPQRAGHGALITVGGVAGVVGGLVWLAA